VSIDSTAGHGTAPESLPVTRPAGGLGRTTIFAIAYRNLGRSRRRTWLTASGVAFSVFIMVFAWSAQVGTFRMMMENATAMMAGHLQINHPQLLDDAALRHTVLRASDLAAEIERLPEVVGVSIRGTAFGLISADDRSFGGQIMGVDPVKEPALSTLSTRISQGRYLQGNGEAVLGEALARNLGVEVGGEVVVLGTTKDGGFAALAADVVGILTTDIAELDRSLMQVSLADFQDAFGLGDEGHILVVKLTDLDLADAVKARLNLGDDVMVRTWVELLPELQQMVDMKKAGQAVFFMLLGIMVTFSTFNTFAMTVFERTREFGMLLAVGMRPKGIIAMLQIEAGLMCLLGITLGLALSVSLVMYLGEVGIPLGDQLGEMMRQYQIPERFHPALSVGGVVPAPLLMLIALQLAALIPAMRVRHMNPAEAMRADA
jgi:ABC-type lipoprotein release transport system permease subunit